MQQLSLYNNYYYNHDNKDYTVCDYNELKNIYYTY